MRLPCGPSRLHPLVMGVTPFRLWGLHGRGSKGNGGETGGGGERPGEGTAARQGRALGLAKILAVDDVCGGGSTPSSGRCSG